MLAQESEQRAGACGTEFLLSNKNNIIYLAGARLAGQAKRRVSTAHHADSTFKISKSSRLQNFKSSRLAGGDPYYLFEQSTTVLL